MPIRRPCPLKPLLLLVLGGFLLISTGCSSSPPPIAAGSMITPGTSPDTMLWNFAARALALHLKATPDLNYVDGQAHTLRLCMYQLEKTDTFNDLASTSEGLTKLMQCERFDPSVKDMNSQIITPGQVESRLFDRAEGARHVAVVAGYGKLEPGLVSRVWDVPAARYESGSLFWKDVYYYPGPLEMIILLGPSSLQRYTEPVGGE
ncbi:MAG: type VI secretion lipoprotein TssJ [Desulfovibrionaceae bacterium]|nr:type VI secretion lipoprotein TssJ [Desulfovibrionaceae bacterium]